MQNNDFHDIEYHGVQGLTSDCLDSLLRIVEATSHNHELTEVKLLTSKHEQYHCFLMKLDETQRIAIKSGFSSGYSGEGPRGLAIALQLLDAYNIGIEEYYITPKMRRKLDCCRLTRADIAKIDQLFPVRPLRWHDYIYSQIGGSNLPRELIQIHFTLPIPFRLIDRRITDLMVKFYESPDTVIRDGYTRLEDILRTRCAVTLYGSALIDKAFGGQKSLLFWEGLSQKQTNQRAALFKALYTYSRNPRAHSHNSVPYDESYREFLLMNELYLLEDSAVLRELTVE